MEAIIRPTDIPPTNYIASQVTLDIVTCSFVVVRLFAYCSHHKKLFADV
jgi:hypothetical protein